MRHRAAVTAVVLLGLTAACNEILEQPMGSTSVAGISDLSAPLATVSRIDLGTLGGANSFATDVNDQGTVVGVSQTADGSQRAFRWTIREGMTELEALPGDDRSRAISITNTGEVFGLSGRSGSFGSPVVWTPSGTVTPVLIPPVTPGGIVDPQDRNERGLVVGTSIGPTHPSDAWVWNPQLGLHDVSADIPEDQGESYGNAINTSGLVVVVVNEHLAVCRSPRAVECWRTFLWNSHTGPRDIGIPSGYDPNVAQVTGIGLNDVGMVVGWTSDHGAEPPSFPFVWSDRTGFTLLPNFSNDPGGFGGYAEAVNLMGTAVGLSWDGRFQAAAWPRSGGIVRLNPEDGQGSGAMAINVVGTVVGSSRFDGNETHATLWKLGPGRGVPVAAATASSSTPGVTAARVETDPSSGPEACFSDLHALRSKTDLIDCMVQRFTSP